MRKSIKELLSRSFATVESDPITGEMKKTIVDGHSVVTGYHHLAPFEIDALVKQIRKSVANENTDI